MRTDDSSATLGPGLPDGERPYEPENGIRPARHSFIRLCLDDPYEADSLYGEPATIRSQGARHRELLANDQLNFTVNLLHLERLLQGVPEMVPGDEPSRIQARLADLGDVRDAIEALLSVRSARLERMLLSGGSFSAYLKGLYVYCEGIVEAFEDALCDAGFDGPALRFRLGEASQFYFDGLPYAIRSELSRDDDSAEALAASEELFFAATFLNEQIVG